MMLTAYLEAAMRQAHYEILEEDGTIYGSIPVTAGVWATAATLESCREAPRSALEDWVLLGLRMNDPLSVLDGGLQAGSLDLNLNRHPQAA